MLGVIPAHRQQPVEPRLVSFGGQRIQRGEHAVAVAVGAPHLGQRLPHQLRGAHRGPRGAADRRHVGLTGEHRIHRVEFAATGVAVLADVGVEADHLQVRLGDARPAQIIERQDGRVRRVGGPERKALSGNVFSAVQIAAGMCNEHGV